MPDWCKQGGSRGYVTTQPVNWDIMYKGSPWPMEIPEGREFESSVPRALQCFWSPDDPFFLKAALIHDVLLESGSRPFEADSQWRAVALSEKAPPFKAGIAYAGMILRRYIQWILKGK